VRFHEIQRALKSTSKPATSSAATHAAVAVRASAL